MACAHENKHCYFRWVIISRKHLTCQPFELLSHGKQRFDTKLNAAKAASKVIASNSFLTSKDSFIDIEFEKILSTGTRPFNRCLDPQCHKIQHFTWVIVKRIKDSLDEPVQTYSAEEPSELFKSKVAAMEARLKVIDELMVHDQLYEDFGWCLDLEIETCIITEVCDC